MKHCYMTCCFLRTHWEPWQCTCLPCKSKVAGSALVQSRLSFEHPGCFWVFLLEEVPPTSIFSSLGWLVGEGNGSPLQYSSPGKSHGWRSLVGYSPWGCEESDVTERLHFHFSLFMHWRRKWQPTPVFFPGESHEQGSLVGCCLWGHTESDTTEAT